MHTSAQNSKLKIHEECRKKTHFKPLKLKNKNQTKKVDAEQEGEQKFPMKL